MLGLWIRVLNLSNHLVIHNFLCFFTSVSLSGCYSWSYVVSLRGQRHLGVCSQSVPQSLGPTQRFSNRHTGQLLTFPNWTYPQQLAISLQTLCNFSEWRVTEACLWLEYRFAQQLLLVKFPGLFRFYIICLPNLLVWRHLNPPDTNDRTADFSKQVLFCEQRPVRFDINTTGQHHASSCRPVWVYTHKCPGRDTLSSAEPILLLPCQLFPHISLGESSSSALSSERCKKEKMYQQRQNFPIFKSYRFAELSPSSWLLPLALGLLVFLEVSSANKVTKVVILPFL